MGDAAISADNRRRKFCARSRVQLMDSFTITIGTIERARTAITTRTQVICTSCHGEMTTRLFCCLSVVRVDPAVAECVAPPGGDVLANRGCRNKYAFPPVHHRAVGKSVVSAPRSGLRAFLQILCFTYSRRGDNDTPTTTCFSLRAIFFPSFWDALMCCMPKNDDDGKKKKRHPTVRSIIVRYVHTSYIFIYS